MRPPYTIAAYMERLGKEDNYTHCELIIHSLFTGLLKFKPYVHLNAIESFRVLD